MHSINDELTQLSTLFERLGAVAHELEYCKVLFPEYSEQLDRDTAETYAIMRRIEQWASNKR